MKTSKNSEEHQSILLTGCAGFIGSHLLERFLVNGWKVTGLDNLATGNINNMAPHMDHPSFEFVEGDIRDFELCKKLATGCSLISHQAALGSVPRSLEDPLTSNDVNVTGFLNILEAARQTGIKRVVYAASSSTYGDAQALPKVEDVIGKPLSPYAVTKLVNEIYAGVYHKSFGIDTIGLRYFNVFGERQKPDGAYAAVIPKFLNLLIDGKQPTINGDGSYSRDFTYIENVVEANILALTTTEEDAINEVYNIAYGKRNTLLELVAHLKKALSNYKEDVKNIDTIFVDNRKGDVPHSLASISKARNLLGYSPVYDLENGLEKTVEWFWKQSKQNN